MSALAWGIIGLMVVGIVVLIARATPERVAEQQQRQQLLSRGLSKQQVQQQITEMRRQNAPRRRKAGLWSIGSALVWIVVLVGVSLLTNVVDLSSESFTHTIIKGVLVALVIAAVVRGTINLIQGIAQLLMGR